MKIVRAAIGILLAVGVIIVVARAGVTQKLIPSWSDRLQGRAARTHLIVWDWWAPSTSEKYAAYFGAVEREFEALHPDVDVIFQYVPFDQYEQKLATGLNGHTPPDVMQASVSWAEGFYDRGMLLPLNAFMEKDRAEHDRLQKTGQVVDTGALVEKRLFVESGWRHNTKPDGTVFGIPQILDAQCLIWNLDILRKAVDEDDAVQRMFARNPDGSMDLGHLRWDAVRNWEELRQIARRLTKRAPNGEVRQAGFTIHAHGSEATPFQPWLAANGSNFQNPEGTKALFAGDAGVEAIQLLGDLYWKDGVSAPFRRQMMDEEAFNAGNVACAIAGTWSGKYVARNTEGRLRFDMTAFPPGPRGKAHTTETWGNMLVITRGSRNPSLAWEYVRFVTSLRGALRLLKHTEQNSPRLDFYSTPEWQRMCRERPYLRNLLAICASGKKRRHTQTNAVEYATRHYFETLLLRYPEIQKGSGPFPSVKHALEQAAARVNRIYSRYNAQVAAWRSAQLP